MSLAFRRLLYACIVPCIHGCGTDPLPDPAQGSPSFLGGEVQYSGPAEAQGTLALFVRSPDGRVLVHLVSRDLADPAVQAADGLRTMRFRLQPEDLAAAGAEVQLEARYDPDGLVATDEPGSLRQRRIVALGGGTQRFLLETPPVTAESAVQPRKAR